MSKILSPRKLEILRLVASGNSNKKIALILGIREQTVKNHLFSAMEELGANNRSRAVVLALKLGMITLDEIT